jgi:uncharacterized membrane protein
VLTLTVPTTTPSGTYQVIVLGTDDNLTHSTTITVRVVPRH